MSSSCTAFPLLADFETGIAPFRQALVAIPAAGEGERVRSVSEGRSA